MPSDNFLFFVSRNAQCRRIDIRHVSGVVCSEDDAWSGCDSPPPKTGTAFGEPSN
jgi:hypothetical protein